MPNYGITQEKTLKKPAFCEQVFHNSIQQIMADRKIKTARNERFLLSRLLIMVLITWLSE